MVGGNVELVAEDIEYARVRERRAQLQRGRRANGTDVSDAGDSH